MLHNIEPVTGGSDLTIHTNMDGQEYDVVNVFLPEDVPPHIKGDGLLPLGLLTEIVNCENWPQVEIKLEPGESNIAGELAVVPFELSGTVLEDGDSTDDLITLDVDYSDEDRHHPVICLCDDLG